MADLHRKTKQSYSAIILKAKASLLNQRVLLQILVEQSHVSF